MDLAELLTVETSVLRTLCLTVNSESSELKTRITENLIVDDFYFPITKSIFGAISDLAKDGTNVDPNSLEQELSRRSIDVPDDFFLEDLFRGEAPSPIGGLNSLNRLKSGNGDEPGIPEGEAAESKEHYLQKTHPSVKSKEAETPPRLPRLPSLPTSPLSFPSPPKLRPRKKRNLPRHRRPTTSSHRRAVSGWAIWPISRKSRGSISRRAFRGSTLNGVGSDLVFCSSRVKNGSGCSTS